MEYIISNEKINLLKDGCGTYVSTHDFNYYVERVGKELFINVIQSGKQKFLYVKGSAGFEHLEGLYSDSSIRFEPEIGSFDFKHHIGNCSVLKDRVQFYNDKSYKIVNNCIVNESGTVFYDIDKDKIFVKYKGLREIKKSTYDEFNKELDALKKEMDNDVEPLSREIINFIQDKIKDIPEEKSSIILRDIYYILMTKITDYNVIKEDACNIRKASLDFKDFIKTLPLIKKDIKRINRVVDAAIYMQRNNIASVSEENSLQVFEDGVQRQYSNQLMKELITFDDIEENLEVMYPGFANLSKENLITNPLDSNNKAKSLKLKTNISNKKD